MALQGIWFDGKTSASIPVAIHMDDAGTLWVTSHNQPVTQAPFAAVRVSARIGNTARYLYFPQGEKCETRDHAQVDAWLQTQRPSFAQGLAHKLESHIYFVALTLVLVVAFTYGMITYGLPAATRYIAFKLPSSVMNRAATETLQFLDKTQMQPSQLDEPTRARILTHFAPALAQNKDLQLKVIFRHAPVIGANAFALPDGTVLFTDDIVRLAKNDDELLAVLAHEMGHVKYRHSLRAAIQGSVVSFGVAMLTGDVSAASNLLASLPLIITNMSYSRDFEREADDNSLVFLDANHIQRHYFVDLLERLGYQAECRQLMQSQHLLEKITQPGSSAAAQSSSASGDKTAEKVTAQIDENKTAASPAPEDDFFNADAHRQECDKLIAEQSQDFWHAKVSGFFASHPDTHDRTRKFAAQPTGARQ